MGTIWKLNPNLRILAKKWLMLPDLELSRVISNNVQKNQVVNIND